MKLVTGKLTLVLALVALSSSAFAAEKGLNFGSDFNTIIGGQEVQSGDPVQSNTVLVVGKEGEDTFICSGSIIDKDIILTAAHCLGSDGLAKVVVVFRTSIQGQGPVVQASDRRRMSDFLDRTGRNETDWHDVALIKLASPSSSRRLSPSLPGSCSSRSRARP